MKKTEKQVKSDILWVLLDISSVVLAYFIALLLRFDCSRCAIPESYLQTYQKSIAFSGIGAVGCYALFHLYHRVWDFASYRELELCLLSVLSFGLIQMLVIPRVLGSMPLSYYVIGGLLQLGALLLTRFSKRLIWLERAKRRNRSMADNKLNAMVIGGGIAAQMIIREINTSKESNCYVRCAIDDDSAKHGCIIEGVRIVGGRDSILEAAEKYSIKKIFLAIPSLPIEERRDILNICKETGAQLLTLPGLYQLVNEDVLVDKMREVSISDLLGRPPIQVDNSQILESLRGKVILVTGGGGSIGSELCRQIAGHSPKQLVILDIYENNAYDIEQELKRKYGTKLNLKVFIGSVRDTVRLKTIFELIKPEIVFHAAAHKHVPLMEDSPCEAIKNNVLGTYKTACAAIASGCRRFVLISTDKAVNPTNIMGASKRLCEMVVQTLDHLSKTHQLDKIPILRPSVHMNIEQETYNIESPLPFGQRTEFVAVRFGNVLGSNGSVIPLFKKQISEGGPVTVTSPDIIRYFMTIPEAVSLVLQAETYANGGEIFVFDMGEPMKIDTLARNLIRLSGHVPDVDIKIIYTGLRPGEKLYEERLMSEEGLRQTANKLISIANPIEIDIDVFLRQLVQIAYAAYNDSIMIKKLVSEIVRTYHFENPR